MIGKNGFNRLGGVVSVAVLACLVIGLNGRAIFAESDVEKRKAALQEQIRKLEDAKRKVNEGMEKKADESKPTGQSLLDVVDRYEKLLAGCKVKKSERCSDIYATLASLYYDQARDAYIDSRSNYEKAMTVWEKKQSYKEMSSDLYTKR